MMDAFLMFVGLALFALMLPVMYRAVTGPTAIDRIVAVNVIGTKTAVLLVVIGTIHGRVEMFVDFALAYALLNFMGSLAVARYFHRMKNRAELPEGVEKEIL
jgi:multicomponent Na+:H+ antiporter subunit F